MTDTHEDEQGEAAEVEIDWLGRADVEAHVLEAEETADEGPDAEGHAFKV